MSAHSTPQVTYLWKGQVLAYRLLRRHEAVTIGARKGVTFATPLLTGFPARFKLLTPIKDGLRLRLGPGMSGELTLRGQQRTVGDLLLQPAQRRFLRDPGMFRHTELYPGDTATIDLDAEGSLRLKISFTDPPDKLGRPVISEPMLWRCVGATSLALAILLTVIRVIGDRLVDTSMALTQDRVDRVVKPALETPPPDRAAEQRKKEALAEQARKKAEKEAAESKRAREKEGRLGRTDAPAKETVIPKGREDILRAKVAKTGILAALGSARAPGSGLSQLFDKNSSADMEQAVNGLAGAHLVAGRGTGGLGSVGTGFGGGGTGIGRIQGSGNLDVGAGRGRGRKGPSLGRGREKEVSVGLDTGTPNTEGGLTREQVSRVVRAHAAAVRYCYEKELQRAPSLSGKIEVYWVIRANGNVDRTKIAASTMGSHAVEGCIERQVKNWQFPRSDGETIVQSFPFFFKGGG